MITRKYIVACILALHFLIANGQQTNDIPFDIGDCAAKCLVKYSYIKYNFKAPIYIGDNPEIYKFYVVDTLLKIGPVDHLIKFKISDLQNIPLNEYYDKIRNEVLVYDFLIDTSITSDFTYENIEIAKFDFSEKTIEWIEILCEDVVTEDLIVQVQNKLIEANYLLDLEIEKGIFCNTTRQGLIYYKRENNLPLCGPLVQSLNYETLEHMNIKIW